MFPVQNVFIRHGCFSTCYGGLRDTGTMRAISVFSLCLIFILCVGKFCQFNFDRLIDFLEITFESVDMLDDVFLIVINPLVGIDPSDTCGVSVGNAEVIIAAEFTFEDESVGLVV